MMNDDAWLDPPHQFFKINTILIFTMLAGMTGHYDHHQNNIDIYHAGWRGGVRVALQPLLPLFRLHSVFQSSKEHSRMGRGGIKANTKHKVPSMRLQESAQTCELGLEPDEGCEE